MAVLNLNRLFVFLFKSFFHVLLAAKRTISPVTGFRPFEIDNTAFLASRAVQTAPALRTTNCWRYCRFAEQIHESQATSLGWLFLPLKAACCHSGALGLVRFSVMNKNNAAAFLIIEFWLLYLLHYTLPYPPNGITHKLKAT